MAEKRKVLIIDDEPLILSSLSFILSDEYEVITAEEGISGISMFFEHHPSMVLVDINMPLIDGIEVLNRLREMDKNVPVILMTGKSSKDYLFNQRDNKLKASGYLIKPIFPEELLHTIKTAEKLKHN